MAMAEPRLSVRKVEALFHFLDSAKSKFDYLTEGTLNGVRAFSKVNPALASIVIYALCTGAGFMIWIALALLDLATGTRVLEAAINRIDGLNEYILPALQLVNGLLALLAGFSILMGRITVNSNRSRLDAYTMTSTLSRRSKMIRALPKAKYGSLRISDDVHRNDSSSSSCAICLGCIGDITRLSKTQILKNGGVSSPASGAYFVLILSPWRVFVRPKSFRP